MSDPTLTESQLDERQRKLNFSRLLSLSFHQKCFCEARNAPNSFWAGAPPRTPLRSSRHFPRPHNWLKSGIQPPDFSHCSTPRLSLNWLFVRSRPTIHETLGPTHRRIYKLQIIQYKSDPFRHIRTALHCKYHKITASVICIIMLYSKFSFFPYEKSHVEKKLKTPLKVPACCRLHTTKWPIEK